MRIYQQFVQAAANKSRLLAVLIDPEKTAVNTIASLMQKVNQSLVTHVFVGGSTDKDHQTQSVVQALKKHTELPLVLFPGSADQVVNNADAILFLSLLSGTNPKFLIEQQVASALLVHKSNLEVIPTGYILLDGGKQTSVQRVTQTEPLANQAGDRVLKTALAGQFSGKQLIYLEAGSGALHPVNPAVIQLLKRELSVPLIVGGGIKTVPQLEQAYRAGADMVVIGSAFENNPNFFDALTRKDKVTSPSKAARVDS